MYSRNLRVVTLLVMLMIPAMACNLVSRLKPTPTVMVPVSSQAAQSLEEVLSTAAEQARQTGQVDLVVTEQQLTSYVALELQSQGENTLTDVQILLREGKMTMTGQVQQDDLSAPLEMTLSLRDDGAGGFAYTIETAKVGPLPLPQLLLDAITEQMDLAIQDSIHQVAGDVYIESINIADGQMAIKGYVK